MTNARELNEKELEMVNGGYSGAGYYNFRVPDETVFKKTPVPFIRNLGCKPTDTDGKKLPWSKFEKAV